MNIRILPAFLLITALLSGTACAQMNYEPINSNLTYQTMDEGDAMPELIDVLDEATDPDEALTIIGGADGPTSIFIAGSIPEAQTMDLPEDTADTWPKTITITMAGDTTLGSTDKLRERSDCFERVAEEEGYAWFFSGLTDLFASDDLTLINFEGTLTEATKKTEKKFNFKGPAEYAEILTLGSVEAVNIANNHIIDYGAQGSEDTIANLESAGLLVSGNGKFAVFEKDGIKVGMTGYTFPYKDGKKDISKDVQALRDMGCQIVIASFHWGGEYLEKFTADQRNIGRAAIKSGADIVVGHHPHIVQGIERYDDTYILYSVGNLVFGGNTDPTDRDAYAARVTFTVYEDHADAPELTIVPLRLTEKEKGTDYRPIIAEGEEADRIVSRILRRSYKMEDFENGTW